MPTPERLKPAKGVIIGLAICVGIWLLGVASCSGYQALAAQGKDSQESFSAYRSAHTEEAARLARGQ